MEIEFGKRLKELRIEKNLSKKELAEILGVQRATLKRWEEGITTPTLSKIVFLCNFFNIRCNYLIGLDDKKTAI